MANPNPSPLTRFKPGENGRSKKRGDRDRLTSKFLYELAESFELNGRTAIDAVMIFDTPTYLKVIAALVPKEVEITRPLDGISDEELVTIIEFVKNRLSGVVTEVDEQPTVN